MEDLFKLSGMAYKQGYFTPAEWESKTGINPLKFPDYIQVKNGLCIWTEKAENLYNRYIKMVSHNWTAGLGISHIV